MVSLAIGIWLTHFVRFNPGEPIGLILAFLLLALVGTVGGSPRAARVCLCLAMIPIGIWSGEHNRRLAPPSLNAETGETVVLAGCVVEPSVFSEDREQFTIELAPGARVRTSI